MRRELRNLLNLVVRAAIVAAVLSLGLYFVIFDFACGPPVDGSRPNPPATGMAPGTGRYRVLVGVPGWADGTIPAGLTVPVPAPAAGLGLRLTLAELGCFDRAEGVTLRTGMVPGTERVRVSVGKAGWHDGEVYDTATTAPVGGGTARE